MFKIEELLGLFQGDTEIIKIISSTYEVSQKQNKELSDSVFQQLLFLKSIQPNLYIRINYQSNEESNYSPVTNTINLNGIFEETTFLHELTHLFSYYYSKFDIPKEYYDFKNKFFSSGKNASLVVLFLNLCEKEKQKILKSTLSVDLEKNIDKNLINMSAEGNYDYFIINIIEDIIDSLYSGKPHTSGLTYINDNNSNAQRTYKSAGHGCNYFDKTGYEFEEILADYQSIKLIDPNNKLFILLKQILGDEFVSFLDDRCQKINSEKLIEFNLNNNIIKN